LDELIPPATVARAGTALQPTASNRRLVNPGSVTCCPYHACEKWRRIRVAGMRHDLDDLVVDDTHAVRTPMRRRGCQRRHVLPHKLGRFTTMPSCVVRAITTTAGFVADGFSSRCG